METPEMFRREEKHSGIPENVLNRGLQATLHYIQKERGIIAAPLKRHVAQVQGDMPNTALTAEHSPENVRNIEINAITAHLIASVWPLMRHWIKENPGGIAHATTPEAEEIEKVSEGSIRSRFFMSPDLGFRDFREYAMGMTQYFADQGVKTAVARGDRSVQRLVKLLAASPRHLNAYKGDPAFLVASGFTTANDAIWGLLNSIPHVYRQQFGAVRPLTPEIYQKLATSAKQLTLTMATAHLNTFTSMRDILEGGDSKVYQSRLRLEGLYIKEDSTLDFSPEVLRKVATTFLEENETRKEWVRTGCPALFVSGQEGANVISDYFDWCYSLTEKYYLPTLSQ